MQFALAVELQKGELEELGLELEIVQTERKLLDAVLVVIELGLVVGFELGENRLVVQRQVEHFVQVHLQASGEDVLEYIVCDLWLLFFTLLFVLVVHWHVREDNGSHVVLRNHVVGPDQDRELVGHHLEVGVEVFGDGDQPLLPHISLLVPSIEIGEYFRLVEQNEIRGLFVLFGRVPEGEEVTSIVGNGAEIHGVE